MGRASHLSQPIYFSQRSQEGEMVENKVSGMLTKDAAQGSSVEWPWNRRMAAANPLFQVPRECALARADVSSPRVPV